MHSEETLSKIIDLGSLGYPARKCINILGLEGEAAEQFLKDFSDPKSEVFSAYNIGKDKADFEIDAKLLQLAKAGDLKAIQMLDDRLTSRQWEEKRNKIKKT